MGLEKTIRTFSEKATSVESEIEVSQKGVLGFRVFRAQYNVIIPTNVKVVKSVEFTPMNASTAHFLTNGYHSDLALYEATNSNVSTAIIRSASVDDVTYTIPAKDFLVLTGRNLYQSVASMTSTLAASNSLITGSESLWTKQEDYGSNSKKYLVITGRIGASAASFANLKLAYDVRGYARNE